MSAQDEYLRNFCILLTEKGVVPLTDPLQIAVYNSLLDGMKRPSDLTAELGLSSSSLHFIIDKMADSGIIDRIKPDTDKKSVYYSTSAKMLASSMETNEKLRTASERTFVDPLKNYKGLSSLTNMLDCYVSEIGVNVDPLTKRYANALADSIDIGRSGFEDAIMDARDIFVKLTGYSFTLYSSSPLTLVLTGDDTISEKAPVLMQFVIRLIENATGMSYRVTGSESFNGSDTMVKITMERCERCEEPYLNTSLFHRDTERFLMVDVDGTAGLMTSDVQIDIIDSIYERPLCITDIVNKVDSPRSTITSNLLRMVEEGVISVFYSESGSAYYGLACSILLKKSRPISSDNEELRSVLDTVKDKENGFMEGKLLYTLAYLKKLGFDSEYLMVVLGAKYMRATGDMETQGNFDTYFGNMSDIAKAIGLSLNIVSVYPLTIGISSTDPKSEMLQAMTFIKGMAHQGLEMASSGIFVRSTDEKPEGENISFKEIYPALSMTPVRGVMVESLSPAPAAKKRTSSVKTALLNRSRKEADRPARTVRYITAAVFMVMLSAILVFGMSATTSVMDAQTFDLTVDDSLDAVVYDENGDELNLPYSLREGTCVTLVLSTPQDIGYVSGGMAFLMEPVDIRTYKVTMDKDLYVEPLMDLSYLESMDCSFALFNSGKTITGESEVMLIGSEEYKARSGGLYVSCRDGNNMVMLHANDDFCILSGDDRAKHLDFMCSGGALEDVRIIEKPDEIRRVIVDGPHVVMYGDQRISSELIVDDDTETIPLRIAGDKNVIVEVDGQRIVLDRDNGFNLDLPPGGDVHIVVKEQGLI